MLSNYLLLALPEKKLGVPLSGDSTIIGRKLLSDLNIFSALNKKKLCVSRKQLTIGCEAGKVRITMIGVNPIQVKRADNSVINLEKDQSADIEVNDVFTLCGEHFPFQLTKRQDYPNLPLLDSTLFYVEEKDKGDKKDGLKRTFSLARSMSERNIAQSELVTGPLGDAAIGCMVSCQLNDSRPSELGKIKSFDKVTLKYEVLLNNGSTIHESEMKLRFITRPIGTFQPDQKKRKFRDEEEEEEEEKPSKNSKEGREMRQRQRVSYTEWISSSSGEEEEIERQNRNKRKREMKEKEKKKPYETEVKEEMLAVDGKTAVLHHPMMQAHLVPSWHKEKPERLGCIMEMV